MARDGLAGDDATSMVVRRYADDSLTMAVLVPGPVPGSACSHGIPDGQVPSIPRQEHSRFRQFRVGEADPDEKDIAEERAGQG